jgi:hypothetical protein
MATVLVHSPSLKRRGAGVRNAPAATPVSAQQTARVTFLTTPEAKAQLEARAAGLGVSSGEYIRMAVEQFAATQDADVEALRAVAQELEAAVPGMQASLAKANDTLTAVHAELDAFFRAKGLRA